MGRDVSPNDLFRAARERLPSPSGAPGPTSRQELADAVNLYLYREHGVKEKLNQDHIGKIERGQTRWPGKWRRVGLRGVLGASDAELGFYFYRSPRPLDDDRPAAPRSVERWTSADQVPASPPHDARVPARPTMILEAEDGEVDATNRRQALTGALGLFVTLAAGKPDEGFSTAQTKHLTAVIAGYRRLERAQPSRLLIGPVAGCVELAGHIIRTNAPAGGQMHAALSEVAGLAAWLCIDIQDTANARRYYRIAIKAAERSGHTLLPPYMRASLGQFAAETGDTTTGLNLVRGARHRLPRNAPPLAHVWLDAVEARVLAERRDAEALTLLHHADQQLATVASNEPVWPWVFRFDRPKLAGYQAIAATRLGRTADAEAAFAEAANASAPKQYAVLQVEHAHALWAAGQQEASCAFAVSALEIASSFESERVHQKVRTLRSRMGHCAGPVTTELDERLAAVYQEPT